MACSVMPAAAGNPPTLDSPRRRRLSPILARLIVRELLPPTLLLLALFALVVLARDLLGYMDMILNRGLGVGEVAAIAGYRLLPVIGQTLPFAVLVGSMIGLGRLGGDREILAMEASGLSARQLMVPLLFFGAVASAAGLAISLVGAPHAAGSLERALARMAHENPSTTLRSGAVRSFGDWKLEAKQVSPRGDSLRGVMLYAPPLGETIFAERAELEPESGGGLRLSLRDGIVVTRSGDGASQARFGRMVEHLQPDQAQAHLDEEFAARSFGALLALSRVAGDRAVARQAAIEWQQRLALPLTALLFGVLAVPLFFLREQRTRAGAAVLGISAGVAYYALVQAGNAVLHSRTLPVALGVWLPDGAGVLAFLWLFVRLLRRGAGPRERRRAAARGGGAAGRRRLPMHRFILDRHVVGLFLEMALGAFTVLLAAYFFVDVLDNMQWFAKYHSTLDEIYRFYLARLPLLGSRVVPLALLVGSALTVSLLAVGGELLAMRACGVSTLRTVTPVLLVCVIVGVGYQGLSNGVLPRTNTLASRIKHYEIKHRSAVRSSVWYRVDDRVYQLDRLDPLQGIADGVTIYRLDRDGLPTRRIDAVEARHIGKGVWRLIDPKELEIGSHTVQAVAAPSFARLGADVPADRDPSELSISQLRREIRAVEAGGYDATPHRVDLNLKLAAPFACLVLPALALLFAASGPPFPTPGQMLFFSVVAAAVQVTLTAGFASLGYGGFVPPWLAGWGPTALLGAAALWLAARARGFGWAS